MKQAQEKNSHWKARVTYPFGLQEWFFIIFAFVLAGSITFWPPVFISDPTVTHGAFSSMYGFFGLAGALIMLWVGHSMEIAPLFELRLIGAAFFAIIGILILVLFLIVPFSGFATLYIAGAGALFLGFPTLIFGLCISFFIRLILLIKARIQLELTKKAYSSK